FFFSSRRRHTRSKRDWSSDVCSSDLAGSGWRALAEAPCDLLVCAIGVVPNTGFLADSGLRLSKGGAVEVDDALRASAPDVWAAGDCANVTWADGSRRPEQLWYTARDQGRVAAASMLGDAAT